MYPHTLLVFSVLPCSDIRLPNDPPYSNIYPFYPHSLSSPWYDRNVCGYELVHAEDICYHQRVRSKTSVNGQLFV